MNCVINDFSTRVRASIVTAQPVMTTASRHTAWTTGVRDYSLDHRHHHYADTWYCVVGVSSVGSANPRDQRRTSWRTTTALARDRGKAVAPTQGRAFHGIEEGLEIGRSVRRLLVHTPHVERFIRGCHHVPETRRLHQPISEGRVDYALLLQQPERAGISSRRTESKLHARRQGQVEGSLGGLPQMENDGITGVGRGNEAGRVRALNRSRADARARSARSMESASSASLRWARKASGSNWSSPTKPKSQSLSGRCCPRARDPWSTNSAKQRAASARATTAFRCCSTATDSTRSGWRGPALTLRHPTHRRHHALYA